MLRLNLDAGTNRLRLSLDGPGGGRPLRVWRDDEAARILDESIEGWRDLGSFSARGRRVMRRVFLAATAIALARDHGNSDPGGVR